jgi:hypothetical protein
MLVMNLSYAEAVAAAAVVVLKALKLVSLERRRVILIENLRRSPRVTEGSGKAISDYVVIDMIKITISRKSKLRGSEDHWKWRCGRIT